MSQQQPSPEELAKWQRRIAARANNKAWELSEKLNRTPGEDQEMLHAAHAAMHLWCIVGNENNKAHAEQLLAHVCALLGDATHAAKYFQSPSAFFSSGKCEAWEVAISRAVAANVAACAGDVSSHQSLYKEAESLIAAIPSTEDREILLATLRVVPTPKGKNLAE
jgi:3-methyladenine DNA glycosylase/8-oxoguanine DNA glycosylase